MIDIGVAFDLCLANTGTFGGAVAALGAFRGRDVAIPPLVLTAADRAIE
jgi:hypothetical protein